MSTDKNSYGCKSCITRLENSDLTEFGSEDHINFGYLCSDIFSFNLKKKLDI